MAFDISSISKGKARLAPRIVLVGTEKVGKSTWAGGVPDVVFIPIQGERGVDEISAAKFPTCQNYADLIAALSTLSAETHDYKAVCIDSATALEPLVWAKVCADHGVASIEKVGGGFGKGYVEALAAWREIQSALDFLREQRDMTCVLIGHAKVKVFNDPTSEPYDQYQFDLNERAANLWMRWADAILFATSKVFSRTLSQTGDKKVVHATGDDRRVVYTQKRPAHPGGTRYSGIPYELPMDYQAFADALAASK